MWCFKVKNNLTDLLKGRMERTQAERTYEHINKCSSCKKEYYADRILQEQLKELKVTELPYQINWHKVL